MRIIAGSKRGTTIAAPQGERTRPTGDRVREAAYNLIGPVDDARVLDLFAGSGAMGLEALSRGAARAVFVESDGHACTAIRANLEKLHFTGAQILQEDVFSALRQEAGAGRLYDLVLVDPPYESYSSLQMRLSELLPRVLADDGLLVVETAASVEPALPLALVTSRRYGAARLTVFAHS